MKTKLPIVAILALHCVVSVHGANPSDLKSVLAKFKSVRPQEVDLILYQLDWMPTLQEAKERAAKEARPIFLVVVTNSFGDLFSGTLKLEPAGSNDKFRYALLRGKVLLAKGGDAESAFEGELEVVLKYRPDAAEVQAVRGVVEGTYLYRTRGTSREKLRVAIESRPE